MVIRSVGIACREVERLVANQVALDFTDRELLKRFIDSKDEPAFTVLVRRHIGMVFSVARRILANGHDAEDVCQAVFLLLAQNASSCRWQSSIANWLHQTAYHLSLKARTASARRCRRERLATSQTPVDPLIEMSGRELLAILDEELLALPEPLRAPLVLCYLEGATQDEAANRLGCPRSTLKKRLERGRSRLHAALIKRGVGLSVTLLGTLVTQTNAAVRAVLAQNTVQVVRNLASDTMPEGAISLGVRRLLNGGVGMVGWNKLKTVLCFLLVSSVISLAAALSLEGRSIQSLQEATAAQIPRSEAAPAQSGRSSIKVIVQDDHGKPLADARLHVEMVTLFENSDVRELRTDVEGVAQVELLKSFTHLRVWPEKKRFASLWAIWDRAEIPAEYTFRLEPGTTAGGRVLDEQGKPITGAKVQVTLEHVHKDPRGDGRFDYVPWLTDSDSVTTDRDGRWQIDNLPDVTEGELSLSVSHPDFVSSSWESGRQVVATKIMREGKSTLTLKSGVVVRGRVTDPNGKPVKDATVVCSEDAGRSDSVQGQTDAKGMYRLEAIPAGKKAFTIIARGWAPQDKHVELKPGIAAQDFRLAPGKPIRLRIVDSTGKPISQATVSAWALDYARQSDETAPIPMNVSKHGVWEWSSAPDEAVDLEIEAKGFVGTNLKIAGGSMEQAVTLKTNHPITGSVTDALTGQPIPEFKVMPMFAYSTEGLLARPFRAVSGKNGKLDFLLPKANLPFRLRIEAPGYRTQVGREFQAGEGNDFVEDFRLQPSKPLTGIILDTNGQPASKLRVSLATPTVRAEPELDPQQFHVSLNHYTLTDANGRFTFPDPGEPWAVVAQSNEGIVSAEFSADQHDAGSLKLQPWASLRGTYSDNGNTASGINLELRPIRPEDSKWPRLSLSASAKTDRDGRFEFSRVPPGRVSIQVSHYNKNHEEYQMVPSAPIEAKPGEQVNLDIRSRGLVLSGRIVLSGTGPITLDHGLSRIFLARRETEATRPPQVPALDLNPKTLWGQGCAMTDIANAFLNKPNHWCVSIASDGSFRASGVPEGEYDLVVDAYGKSDNDRPDLSGQRVIQLKVSATDITRGDLGLPEIAVEVKKVLK